MVRVCSCCVCYRFKAESSTFVQSPLTVPAKSLLTSTMCSILQTGKTSTANAPQSNDLSLGFHEPGFPSGSHPAQESNPPDRCSNKDHNVAEKRSPSHNDPLLKEHHSQCNRPQMSPGIQGKITQHVASEGETSPQTDPIAQGAELNHSTTLPRSSCCPQPFDGPDRDLHKDNTPSQGTGFLKCRPTFPQNFPDSDSDLHQGMNFSRTSKETSTVSKPQREVLTDSSTVTQKILFFQSSPSDSHCPSFQRESLPQIDPIPQPLTDSFLHKDRTLGLLKSCAPCLPSTPPLPQDGNVAQSTLDSGSALDQDVSTSQTSKETSSVFTPQSSSLTTATTVKHTVVCQTSPPSSHCTLTQTSINLRSQPESPFSQSSGGIPEVHAAVVPETNSISDSSVSGSNRLSNQTVYSFNESLTSSCTQQCVHDPGMTPSSPTKPAAPPSPEPKTQALAPQANPHVTPLFSPPHLLTLDQDPNICQPMTIREEIRLTPQIQGPPLPAPPHAASVSQGKSSKLGPPCFTRPLSRATVMEGSPVTLEVEVTGDPEPRLTWWV